MCFKYVAARVHVVETTPWVWIILMLPMLWFASAAAISGFTHIFIPETLDATSVSQLLPGYWDEVWNAGYLAGGLFTIYGICRPSPLLELGGYVLLCGSSLNQLVALVVYQGVGVESWLSIFFVGSFSLICAAFAYLVILTARDGRHAPSD